MPRRIALLSMLFLSLLLLPGCPGESPFVGTWVMTQGATTFGLEIKTNGEAEAIPLPPDYSTPNGTITWQDNGTDFTLRRENGVDSTIYIGRYSTSTTISGAWLIWDGASTGTDGLWSAVRDD